MSFTTDGSQAFLSANEDDNEAANLAALDSMTSGMSNQSAFMSQQMSSGGTNTAMTPTTTTTTTATTTTNNGGEMGESLFDRIRRRTEEQQRQQQAQAQAAAQAQSSTTNTASSQQPTSTTTESNNTHNIAGLEHEPSDGSIPPTTASTAFDAAVQSAANPTTISTTTEQTYAFTATTGEDFSFQPHQQPPSIPTYGPSRNDPSYYSANNNTPSSLQDRATMAFNDAGDTMKSLFTKGLNGANSLMTSAQSKFSAGGGGGMGSGYTNNFLLREDSMEQGGAPTPSTTAEPMQINATSGSSGPSELNQVSGQAYSMISYAKIFCEDLYGFLMQLPPLGKVGVLVVLIALWLLMRG